ncbi:MAG: DoxX family protein [Thermoanaerobaculia bacterium]
MTNHSLTSGMEVEAPVRRTALWTGRVLSAVAVLFLAMDAAMKLFAAPAAVAGTQQLGYPVSVVVPLGIIQVVCLIVYLVPRTSIFGAVLWTGYLGGAVATHVRLENPLFTHVLFPIYIALLLWGGLWLRDQRMRVMFSAR